MNIYWYTRLMHEPPDVGAGRWSAFQGFAFRCVFVAIAVVVTPQMAVTVHAPAILSNSLYDPWESLAVWAGHHMLGIPQSLNMLADGGDRRVDFIVFGLQLLFALSVGATWSIFAKQTDSPRLLAALRTGVRYYLAFVMLRYGLSKVWKTQFPSPFPDMLFTRLGDLPPDRLFWNFMGSSALYTVFGGLAELAGGVLLLFRRTTTLGAIVITGVLTNVVVLNFSYDVIVKLYSSTLLLLAVFLWTRDAPPLAAILVFQNKPTAFVSEPPAWNPRRAWLRGLVKAIVIASVGGSIAWAKWNAYKQWGDAAPKKPLAGVYEVEKFRRDGEELPPLVTDPVRWRRFAISNFRWVSIQSMKDVWTRADYLDDPVAQTFTLRATSNFPAAVFHYREVHSDELELAGAWNGSPVEIQLRRVPESSIKLLAQRVRLIQD